MVQVSVEDARELLASASPPLLLDCRLEEERRYAVLVDDLHIPLHELPERWQEVPTGRPVLVYCHHGVRSVNAAVLLERAGYATLSMRGGIDAWSLRIDPTVPRYG